MTNHRILNAALALFTALSLTGCGEDKERGLSRIPELTQPATPVDGQQTPAQPNSEWQAPPLHLASGHGNDHSAATTASAAADESMMIQPGQTKVMAGGNILQVAGLAFTVSDTWKNVKPESSIRVAEYELPGSGGPAQMAVFYFGKNQGGGIEDNIKRWAGQFTADATTTGTGGAQVGRVEKETLQLALVKTEGTYDPGSMGPMAPSPGPQPNFALFGLVVAGGPEGSVFIKVTGPKATLAEQDEALEAMAQSSRVSEYK